MSNEDTDPVPLAPKRSIRDVYRGIDVGPLAAIFLRNSPKSVPISDYELVDDIREIVGPGDMDTLREFVELAMMYGCKGQIEHQKNLRFLQSETNKRKNAREKQERLLQQPSLSNRPLSVSKIMESLK